MSDLPPVRRVVTGHDARGRSTIASDGPPPAVHELPAVPGTVFYEIWSTDASPARIDDGLDPTLGSLELPPPPRGSRIRIVDIPPDSVQNAVSEQDAAATFAALGAAQPQPRPDAPHRLMHRTATVDYGIVLAGEVWLVLEDGETRLRPGDVVVQRGTNHAWSNRTNATARMAFVLLDGVFADELR